MRAVLDDANTRIRVFIAGPVRVYREALAEMLDRQDEIDVVGMADRGTEVVARAVGVAADAVVLDPSTPGTKDAIRTLARLADGVRVVVIGVQEDGSDLVSCAEAGALGFVSRDEPTTTLTATIRSVAQGEVLVSAKAAATLLRRVAALAAGNVQRQSVDGLTPREAQVLQLLEKGLSNKQIGQELSIELPTVKQHVHHILGKLNVSRRAEAVALISRPVMD